MSFLLSPGVQVNEKDLSNVVPAVATSIGAFAGPFRWGPTGEAVTIASENELRTTFGKPTATTAISFQTAASFLKYGNTLKVSRSIDATNAKNAAATFVSSTGAVIAGQTVPLIGNTDTFNSLTSAQIGLNNTFIARYPGALGNSLGVYVVTAQTPASDTYARLFDYIPTYTTNNPAVVRTATVTSTTSTNTLLFTSSAFGTIALTTSMYVVGGSVASGAVVTISSFEYAGSNSAVTLGSSWGATSTATTSGQYFTFFEPDEIHIAVIDLDGAISGTAGTVLEKWQNLSLLTDGKRADGTNNYYRDYLARNSSYIYANVLGSSSGGYITNADTSTTLSSNWIRLPLAATTSSLVHVLGNTNYVNGQTGPSSGLGVDGTVSSADISTALDVFADAATIDINLLFCGDTTGTTALTTAEQKVQTIANTRKDVIGFISAPPDIYQKSSDSAKQTAVLTKFNDQSATRDSYSVFDSSPLYVYNKYQDNYIWIPACGHMAGLCANTDTVADAWFSPGGYNRGGLKGVTKLAFNPSQTQRDALYQASVNPIVAFPGQGILLFGDKTAQTKPSAFDRINVRRLFIVLEKAIATAAKYQLFELNDQFTQAMFRNMVEPFLRDIVGRRGITDFLVVCDSTNNTSQIVDANQFVADIYVKPARSINFITLNFVATRSGVNFSEIAGA